MDTLVKAQIYLADQRGCSETALLRSYHTFNTDAYQAEGREPFGALHRLDDDTLRAGTSLTATVDRPMTVLLLPVTGSLEYNSPVAGGFLEPGQAGLLSLAAGMPYQVSNPYETESINLLQIWLAATPVHDLAPAFSQYQFDLTQKNTLIPIVDTGNGKSGRGLEHHALIGRYEGRQDGVYSVKAVANGLLTPVFVFVLQGAFEVANRLLQERDGLALTYQQAGELDYEALSSDAILMLFDLSAVVS